MVAIGPQQKPQRLAVLHSVIISSKDEKETGDEVMDRVRKTIDEKEGWVCGRMTARSSNTAGGQGNRTGPTSYSARRQTYGGG